MLIKRLQGQSEKRNGYYYEFDIHSKPLGEGGMGVVYKGFKVYEATGNRSVVAIKAMFDDLPSEVYERAEREASIRLRNDNLVEMLGFISEIEIEPYGKQKPKYYVISEYLNGVVLSDLLAGQFKDKDGIEIPYAKQLYTEYITEKEKTSIEIIKCILSGIMALHDKGFIHRDIDPTNIMVTDAGTIKLIDFGIAKNMHTLGTIDKSLTSTGKFIGKAEYAAPELVLGDVKNQGYHTDIYAIGIVIYQLLTGKQPFTGSKYEVLQMQLKKKVPIQHIKSTSLGKIIKKATEKKESDRYATVAELRVELDKIIIPHPEPTILKYWKHGIIALLSSVACASLIFWYTNRKPEDPVEEHHQNKITNREQAEGIAAADTEKIRTTKLTADNHSETFKSALTKLNSSDKNKAEEGLSLMTELAEKKHPEAIKELGLTYCIHNKVQSANIQERRKTLNFNNKTDIVKSIKYLESIETDSTMTVDALYALGYSYWQNEEWSNGIKSLSKALEKLSTSSESNIGGWNKDELREGINKYLKLCKDAEQKYKK